MRCNNNNSNLKVTDLETGLIMIHVTQKKRKQQLQHHKEQQTIDVTLKKMIPRNIMK